VGWREAVGEGFGPHREGEPAELRRDIIDELTDHLDCAMRRELVATPDERAAERKVLARFGDPRQIARRLWLDAMKETIMSQRIMLGVVVLLAAACVAASVFAWLSFRQGQELNEALLARLEDLASRPAAAVSVPSELAVAKIRVVEEGEDGKPVTDAEVSLKGNAFRDVQPDTVSLSTGTDGVATLGPIRPGPYALHVFTPGGFYIRNRGITLFGGSENEKVVVCPRGAGVRASEADVGITFDWFDDIDPDAALVMLTFVPVPSHRQVDGAAWRAAELHFETTGSGEFLVGSAIWQSAPRSARFGKYGGQDLVTFEQVQLLPTMPVRAQSYRLRRVSFWARVPHAMLLISGSGRRGYVKVSEVTCADNASPLFEARHGMSNDWKVEIPPESMEGLREALAQYQEEGPFEPTPNSSGSGVVVPLVPRAAGGFDRGTASSDEQESK